VESPCWVRALPSPWTGWSARSNVVKPFGIAVVTG
jgi:hypothetical protein